MQQRGDIEPRRSRIQQRTRQDRGAERQTKAAPVSGYSHGGADQHNREQPAHREYLAERMRQGDKLGKNVGDAERRHPADDRGDAAAICAQ
jgi:hypothetical protein